MNKPEAPEKLKNQRQLKHIHHLEELIFTDKETGLKAIKYILNSFKNNSKKNIRVKIDGSPSLICGYKDDKFFIATKSFFNKTPKINYSPDDIKINHPKSIDLQNKLFYALKYLPTVIPNNAMCYQGDFLFIDSDLIEKDGRLEFTPNILTYKIQSVKYPNVKMGIVFHTSYENNIANYNPDLSVLKKSDEVFMFNNLMPDTNINRHEISIDSIDHIVNYNLSKEIIYLLTEYENEFILMFNKLIRSGKIINSAEDYYKQFLDTVELDNIYKESVLLIFKLYIKIVKIKTAIISELNKKPEEILTFYKNEFSNPEGYIFLSQFGIVKLIDRSEFSARNFENSKFN